MHLVVFLLIGMVRLAQNFTPPLQWLNWYTYYWSGGYLPVKENCVQRRRRKRRGGKTGKRRKVLTDTIT